jgi:sporulation protein YlmC with PRC-barrel domain
MHKRRASRVFFYIKEDEGVDFSMEKLSDFLGKNVLVLSGAEILGTVADIVYDKSQKKFRYLLVRGGGEEKLLPFSKIFKRGDAVTVMNTARILSYTDIDLSRCALLYGVPGWTAEGKEFGRLIDIDFEEYKITALYFERGEAKGADILSIGKDAIVVRGENDVVIKKASPKKRIKLPKEDYPVEMLDEPAYEAYFEAAADFHERKPQPEPKTPEIIPANEIEAKPPEIIEPPAEEQILNNEGDESLENGPAEKTSDEGQKAVKSDEIDTISTAGITIAEALSGASLEPYPVDIGVPAKIIRDYGFLLGRRVLVNIRAKSGELLAPAGAVVTTLLVDKVKKSGKLIELILNSK